MTREDEHEVDRDGAPPDGEGESEDVPPPRPSGTSRTARIAVGVVAALLLVGLGAVTFLSRREDAGCGDWERQFDQLSEALGLYVRSEGLAQTAALSNVEALDLPCAKVAETRDVCVGVYHRLRAAEREHESAKRALAELERVVGSLEEPERTVAERRFIESEPTFVIADKLDMPVEEVRRHLASAEKTIGAGRLREIHGRFEKAVDASKTHVDAARMGNEQCDLLYKRLLEEEQAE